MLLNSCFNLVVVEDEAADRGRHDVDASDEQDAEHLQEVVLIIYVLHLGIFYLFGLNLITA